MCELFGASGGGARDLSRWLVPFRARGGATGDNPDGWGVASWNGHGVELVKSPEPGHASARFGELARTLRTGLAIAHVRRAKHPPVPGMVNTHPFLHGCCGREWVFAHNGMVPAVIEWQPAASLCHPLGETDSEHAFCTLLAGIAGDYEGPDRAAWIDALARLAARIAAVGKFNFLLSDGRVLVAYGHDRLHHREDDGLALVATEPLGGGDWQAFAPGELRVWRDGALLAQLTASPGAPAH